MVVQVGDRHLWIALAQRGDQLCSRQRAAAERVEVGLRAVDRSGQHVAPQSGQPTHRAAEVGRLFFGFAGRRPWQRIPVDLARRAGGQLVDEYQPGYQRGGQRLGQVRPCRGQVEGRVGAGDIADQQRRPAGSAPHRRGAATDTGQVHQRGVHLAQFDPPTADLDLVVGAAAEDQAVGLEPHQVTAAVRAVPAQRGHRRVLLGILVRVQIAGQAHPADHQFTHLADADRHPVLVDDGQVPARQRQPDADRPGAVQLGGAGDHGGLGGAVGVPHLAAGRVGPGGQPLRKLRRAGLAAEDQQPHRLQRLGGPQRRQCRHRRHHGDVPRHQPWSEIHAAAHQ